MKVVIVGEGGREHALIWKVAQSPLVTQIFALPGNAGTAIEPKTSNIAIAVDAISDIVAFCQDQSVNLCIIGPEIPLVLGVSDALAAVGIACFGPTQAAARLEGSKAFSKAFLQRHNIPTAAYASFNEINAAKAYVEKAGAPIVIKADGLAAGKGVVIANSLTEANAALEDILTHQQFGDAGTSVVIEEFLEGEEASFICMADGKNVIPLASSQDHKAAYDGDTGPNTGGMGAYSPAPVVDSQMHERIMQTIIHPTLNGLNAQGMPYVGFLYAGVMIDNAGEPKVLEFNCRMGDPETQPIMMRLQSDLAQHCLAAVEGKLAAEKIEWKNECALGVVLASEGYPGSYQSGELIEMVGNAEDHNTATKLFYAGVKANDNKLITNGGRVICACALGASVSQAHSNAYTASEQVSWKGMWFRKDIGYRAITREKGG